MMRVTTDLWVSALLRRVFSAGDFAAVIKRGAAEAGAVFVMTRDQFGELRLYGPAPQTSYSTAKPDDRQFTPVEDAVDEKSIDRHLERERRFDPDVWVVEIEAENESVEELITITTP